MTHRPHQPSSFEIRPAAASSRPGKVERALRASPVIALPLKATDPAGQERTERVALALAREFYAGRRRRARFMSDDLFGEPTWDILLDLYVALREGRRVPTTSACIGAHVPPTTALRWLRILEMRGLIEREEDGSDGRRTFVKLSERGLTAMESYLGSMADALQVALSAAHFDPAQSEPLDEAAQ